MIYLSISIFYFLFLCNIANISCIAQFSYGAAGYTQTPVYSSDGNTSGNTRGSYNGAPAPAVQQGGVAKASPPS